MAPMAAGLRKGIAASVGRNVAAGSRLLHSRGRDRNDEPDLPDAVGEIPDSRDARIVSRANRTRDAQSSRGRLARTWQVDRNPAQDCRDLLRLTPCDGWN